MDEPVEASGGGFSPLLLSTRPLFGSVGSLPAANLGAVFELSEERINDCNVSKDFPPLPLLL
jgi:hypothetical protein